jgi:hypothetical protein
MTNELPDMEQFTEADLLAVMLFADGSFVVKQKDMPAGAGSLAPPFYDLREPLKKSIR